MTPKRVYLKHFAVAPIFEEFPCGRAGGSRVLVAFSSQRVGGGAQS